MLIDEKSAQSTVKTTESVVLGLCPDQHTASMTSATKQTKQSKKYWKGNTEYKHLPPWPHSGQTLLAYRDKNWVQEAFYRCPGSCGRVYQHLPTQVPNTECKFYAGYETHRDHCKSPVCRRKAVSIGRQKRRQVCCHSTILCALCSEMESVDTQQCESLSGAPPTTAEASAAFLRFCQRSEDKEPRNILAKLEEYRQCAVPQPLVPVQQVAQQNEAVQLQPVPPPPPPATFAQQPLQEAEDMEVDQQNEHPSASFTVSSSVSWRVKICLFTS